MNQHVTTVAADLAKDREFSSGPNRLLGRISKRGDVYVRMLLVHGARSALSVALMLQHGSPEKLTRLQQRWAVELKTGSACTRPIVGLANKLARICWAIWKHGDAFEPNHAGSPGRTMTPSLATISAAATA